MRSILRIIIALMLIAFGAAGLHAAISTPNVAVKVFAGVAYFSLLCFGLTIIFLVATGDD